MVRLRLRRTGKKKQASYQIVAIDSRKPRDAQYLAKLGHYFPLKKSWDLDKDLVHKWLKVGAQPSLTVRTILKKEKLL